MLKGKKVLVIETLSRHHETILTWLYLFEKLNASLYLMIKQSSKNMTNLVKKLFPNVIIVSPTSYMYINNKFDIVLHNTLRKHFEQKEIMPAKGKLLTLCVLHCYFSKFPKNNKLISLCPGMKSLITSSSLILPIYFGKRNDCFEDYNIVRFVVQGEVSPNRRNYKSLIQAFGKCLDNGLYNFKIYVVGSHKKNYNLQSEINNIELLKHFKIIQDLPYVEFFHIVNKCHWILPLIDQSFTHEYFQNKLSSSISISIGNKIPCILHKKLGEMYKFTDAVDSLFYSTQNEFETQIENVLKINKTIYQKFFQNAFKLYDKWMDNNQSEIIKQLL